MSISLCNAKTKHLNSWKPLSRHRIYFLVPRGFNPCRNITLAASTVVKQVIARGTGAVVGARPVHAFVLAEELWEAAFIHVCSGKTETKVQCLWLYCQKSSPAGRWPPRLPRLTQLEAGTLQLPGALQQPDKMLCNKFFIKHFFPKETKAAAEHNVWLLIIYFSFLIPVTTWSCFHFCFTS